jgi:LysM repeat protein
MNKYLMTFLGVTALVLSSAFAPLSTSMQNALAASSATIQAAAATSTDPTISYTVQPGDTLSALAQTYNTTVAAIVALNPQITDPSFIYSGEVILIPENSTVTTIIPLTGTSTVVTTGRFTYIVQSGDTLEQIAQRYGTTKAAIRALNPGLTASNMYAGEALTIPTEQTVVTTPVIPITGTSTFTYIVQPGDTLALIAQRYDTTKAAIKALNPGLNASNIYAGETITVPYEQTVVTTPIIPLTGVGASAIITPSRGTQGTYIEVVLNGFPAYTSVDLGLHKVNHKLIESHASATTDAYGQAVVTMRIPTGSNVNNNRAWVAQVTTTTGSELTVTSNVFTVTGNK